MLYLGIFIFLQSNVDQLDSLEDIQAKYLSSYANGFGKTLLITWDYSRSSKLYIIKHSDISVYKSYDARINLGPFCSILSDENGFAIMDSLYKRLTFLNKNGDFEKVVDIAKQLERKFQRNFPGPNGAFYLEYTSDKEIQLYCFSLDGTSRRVYTVKRGEETRFFVCNRDQIYICTAATGQIDAVQPETNQCKVIQNPKTPIEIVFKGKKVVTGRLLPLNVLGSSVRLREDDSEYRYFYDIEKAEKHEHLNLFKNIVYDQTELLIYELSPGP